MRSRAIFTIALIFFSNFWSSLFYAALQIFRSCRTASANRFPNYTSNVRTNRAFFLSPMFVSGRVSECTKIPRNHYRRRRAGRKNNFPASLTLSSRRPPARATDATTNAGDGRVYAPEFTRDREPFSSRKNRGRRRETERTTSPIRATRKKISKIRPGKKRRFSAPGRPRFLRTTRGGRWGRKFFQKFSTFRDGRHVARSRSYLSRERTYHFARRTAAWIITYYYRISA